MRCSKDSPNAEYQQNKVLYSPSRVLPKRFEADRCMLLIISAFPFSRRAHSRDNTETNIQTSFYYTPGVYYNKRHSTTRTITDLKHSSTFIGSTATHDEEWRAYIRLPPCRHSPVDCCSGDINCHLRDLSSPVSNTRSCDQWCLFFMCSELIADRQALLAACQR